MSAQFTFEAIGTQWTIDISETLTDEKEKFILGKITERINIFDKNYSRFRNDSLVTRISQTAGTYEMPEDFAQMITIYREMYELTDGLMTPLIGQLISDAGYDKEYSLIQKSELVSPPDWDSVMHYDEPYLTTQIPLLLDFGAAGKGYLIDIVAQVLESRDIHSYTVDAGGDILHRGVPLRIGLENPNDSTQVIGVADIANKSIAGSSGNRRVWGTFNHIINPKKRVSPDHILALWVITENALEADAIATALYFAPAEIVKKKYNFEYVILKNDLHIEKSNGFEGEIFYT